MRFTRYRFGEFQLDPAVRELSRSGERLALPLKSLECVVYLVTHRERAVGRDELVSAVWGRADVSDTVITQTMRRARKALDDAGDRQTMIRTVPGFGYRWAAPVEEVDASAPLAIAPVAPQIDPPLRLPVTATPLPASGSSPPASPLWHRRYRRAAAGMVGLMIVGVAVAWLMRHPLKTPTTQAAAVDERVTVLPVTVEAPGPEYSWVRLGAMEYAAGRLRGAALKVTPTEQTLHLSAPLEQIDGSASPSLGQADLQAVLKRSGARWLIVPGAERIGTQWRVRLRALDGQSDTSVEAQGDTPLQAMAVATDTWLRRIHRALSHAAAPTPLQERLQRIDAELDAGQLEAAREQILAAPTGAREAPAMLVREGQLEYRGGRMDTALALFTRGLAGGMQVPGEIRAKAMMGLGSVALRQARYRDAQQHYTDALDVLVAADGGNNQQELLGNAYNGRGVARVQQDDLEGAVSDLGLARVAMRRSGDVVSAAMVGSNLGRIEGIRNHWPQAVQEFESANEVFARFQVHDYLAATLAAEASAQLELVQPAQASASIARAMALRDRIEDGTLIRVILTAQARVAIANGALQDASDALQGLPAAISDHGATTRLRMSLALARGDRADAARLARQLPASAVEADTGDVAIAVQATDNVDVARRWLHLTPQPPAAPPAQAPAATFAIALMQHRFGAPASALGLADSALAVADRDGSPNDRLRANLLRALVLLDAGKVQEATAVLGELEGYAKADFRVAWLAWTVYNRRGDAALARNALAQAQALRGQRTLTLPPVL
ncbi:DNA-binding winged helix-turn-helix (wHTH) protein/tetratricopeptide (TPR) repeat protein [Stenotrophomonas rhizophila]|uniref:DNA-binding winged helix-turn-helix (WHTH) protein/tetratricopeptide (TPR) repeat protein n=1 Tax=Stenotrophomonas rhizophila TaxID=216778 RepID=A0AAW5PI57_9GAMM|nr:DNA-binding winged helix-turn-helix (wHTH) protein/tetratricopeptide (TPR) repeat protein [Stenotrophomonas rhizophila]